MSAFGAAELARCGRVVCPEYFFEAWFEDVVALGAYIIHALVVNYTEPDGESENDGQTDSEKEPSDTVKDT